MTDIVGTVKKVHIKDGGGTGGKKAWKKYSLLISVDGGEDTWVSCGFGKAPAAADGTFVEEGHRVKVGTETTQYGEELKGVIVISTAEKVAVAPSTPKAGSSNYTDRNTSIVIQSSRNVAIEVIKAAIATDSLPISKGKSAGDRVNRFNLLVEYIDKLTVRYAHDLVADISPEEFRVFGVVQDAFGEGVASPLPDPANDAPADNEEGPEAEATEPPNGDAF